MWGLFAHYFHIRPWEIGQLTYVQFQVLEHEAKQAAEDNKEG